MDIEKELMKTKLRRILGSDDFWEKVYARDKKAQAENERKLNQMIREG